MLGSTLVKAKIYGWGNNTNGKKKTKLSITYASIIHLKICTGVCSCM
jgi:hypothetical protein